MKKCESPQPFVLDMSQQLYVYSYWKCINL